MPSDDKPIIAVIGATGAQGIPLIQHLIKDGAYRKLLSLGPEGSIELVKGTAMSEATVASLFDGAYGAFVNLDGFAMGEKREVYWGMLIFELAATAGVSHYVWGNLDYSPLAHGFDASIRIGHYDGKGRVAQFMKSFPSPVQSSAGGGHGITWSVLTSGPYLQMLTEFLAPIIVPDGTRVFAAPLASKGRVPMIDLDDLVYVRYYARYMFDHPRDFESRDLQAASEHVGWQQLATTFTKVTGLPAVYVEEEEYFGLLDDKTPAGYQDTTSVQPGEDGPMSWTANFRDFFRLWRADVVKRDYAELDRIHPHRVDLEGWMRRTGYQGTRGRVLKNIEDTRTRPLPLWLSVSTFLGGFFKYLLGGTGDLGADVFHNAMMQWLRKARPDLVSPARPA